MHSKTGPDRHQPLPTAVSLNSVAKSQKNNLINVIEKSAKSANEETNQKIIIAQFTPC